MLNIPTLDTSLQPLAVNYGGLGAPFAYLLLNVTIPDSAPVGPYKIMVGFFEPNKAITGPQDAFLLVQTPFSITEE